MYLLVKLACVALILEPLLRLHVVEPLETLFRTLLVLLVELVHVRHSTIPIVVLEWSRKIESASHCLLLVCVHGNRKSIHPYWRCNHGWTVGGGYLGSHLDWIFPLHLFREHIL